jgi:hypothetical protein
VLRDFPRNKNNVCVAGRTHRMNRLAGLCWHAAAGELGNNVFDHLAAACFRADPSRVRNHWQENLLRWPAGDCAVSTEAAGPVAGAAALAEAGSTWAPRRLPDPDMMPEAEESSEQEAAGNVPMSSAATFDRWTGDPSIATRKIRERSSRANGPPMPGFIPSLGPSYAIIFIFFNQFAKLYDSLKIYRIYPPTVVRYGGRREPRRLRPNRHGPWRLVAVHGGWGTSTAVGPNRRRPRWIGSTAMGHDG